MNLRYCVYIIMNPDLFGHKNYLYRIVILKMTFLMSMRLCIRINKSYITVTLPKKLTAAYFSLLVTGMFFLSQNAMTSFMRDIFDIFFGGGGEL